MYVAFVVPEAIQLPSLPKQMEKNHKSIFSPMKGQNMFFCQQLFS